MKIVILVLCLSFSSPLNAETWGPEDIKFTIEGHGGQTVMVWLSGFSYAISSVVKEAGCKAGITQLDLIRALNAVHGGNELSAEQATEELVKALKKSALCNPYNSQPNWEAASSSR